MRRVLAATAALCLLAGGGPALAAAKGKASPVYAPCKAPAGAFAVKPGKPLTMNPKTPVGELLLTDETVGDFYLDLGGKPITSKKGRLTFTLDWDNPAQADYDLIVDGTGSDGTDQPEVVDVPLSHCKSVNIGLSVFLGAPIDKLTLTVTA